MLLSVWPVNGMFLFVLSTEPLTPFYFVFLFIGVLRRVSMHTLAPQLLRLQKYSIVSSCELHFLYSFSSRWVTPEDNNFLSFQININMHVHCWEIKTMWKNTKVGWNLILRQPLVALSANMAALHCFRKDGSSLLSLPLSYREETKTRS